MTPDATLVVRYDDAARAAIEQTLRRLARKQGAAMVALGIPWGLITLVPLNGSGPRTAGDRTASICHHGSMSRTGRLAPTATAITLVLGAATLAGCAATADAATPDTSPSAASPAAEAAATNPDACTNPAQIILSSGGAGVTGQIEDRGAREFAQGTVGLDDEGNIVSYTVAAGDAEYAIGDRLCIVNGPALADLNHVRTVHPDQVLRLTADPDVLYVPYNNPVDAPAGFAQIPYQEAIEAMGRAADAGDVVTMRDIWSASLSGMFTNPADIDGIQRALDAGDLTVLTQMFS